METHPEGPTASAGEKPSCKLVSGALGLGFRVQGLGVRV